MSVGDSEYPNWLRSIRVSTVVDQKDTLGLARVLIYGTDDARQHMAERLAASPDSEWINLIAETARSDEESLVRARCLEVLARAASTGGPASQMILEALWPGDTFAP